jgi:hypothetical protein
MNNIESRKMAIISTAHVTRGDSVILGTETARKNLEGFYYATDCGWGFRKITDENRENWIKQGMSGDSFINIKSVFDQGFDRVELDCDGLIVEGLKTFNW